MTQIFELIDQIQLAQILSASRALLIFLVSTLIFLIIKKSIIHKIAKIAQKNKSDFAEGVKNIINNTKPLLLIFIALYISLSSILASESWIYTSLRIAFQAAVIIQCILILQAISKLFLDLYLHTSSQKKSGELSTIAQYTSKFINISIWTVGILFFLSNIGYDISSLITSLGIGGIAIALAVQNILRDMFSAVTILINRPFQIGDYIEIDDRQHKGIVEKIDLRNTVIRTIDKAELIIPNSKIIDSNIYNYRSRNNRRHNFNIFLALSTKSQTIEKFKTALLEILDTNPQLDNESTKVVFEGYNEFAAIISITYFVKGNDFGEFTATKDTINSQINEYITKNKITLATTTQPPKN